MPQTFNRASVALSTTSITDVYQAPDVAAADRAIVLSCLAANIEGISPVDLTLTITNSADAAIARIASTISVPPDATLECIPNKLVLKRGEKIRATAANASRLEITVSALELT